MLYSQTAPVIESCKNLTFLTNQYSYQGLFEHMKFADLCIWNNKWSDIYNFTEGCNHTCLHTVDTHFITNLVHLKAYVNAYKKVNNLKEVNKISEVIQVFKTAESIEA